MTALFYLELAGYNLCLDLSLLCLPLGDMTKFLESGVIFFALSPSLSRHETKGGRWYFILSPFISCYL